MIQFGAINTIKFYQVNSSFDEFVDWDNVFPNVDNQSSLNMRYNGVLPHGYMHKIKNDEIDFQLQSDLGTFTIELVDCNDNVLGSSITTTDITPAVWSSGNGYLDFIYNIAILPFISSGNVKIRAYDTDTYYLSEEFEIVTSVKGFTEITYGHNRNEYGMLFVGDDYDFVYKIYVDAKWTMNLATSTEKEVSNKSNGQPRVLRSYTQRAFVLNASYIPSWIAERMQFIFGLRNIKINGVSFSAPEGVELEQLSEDYNAYKASINIVQSDWDYTNNKSAEYEIVVIDNDESVLIDNLDSAITGK